MSSMQRAKQWATFSRIWHIYDAKWQNPFESAKLIAAYLKGQHKPIYHPLSDCGDHVVVTNCREIALPGPEWYQRVFFHHTGYPKGGATWTLAWELHRKNPTMIMQRAPRRLDSYTEQEVRDFPKVFDYPADYVVR
ncbi:39S ribosomal protein L13, mitochondrial-like [Pollicipes pollicipes]|uniref:39S ribosomal protein L13, mitochondrial-like n=1 Tax=Pollicipes pollicipes TaxID=41117 RepID=UPI001885A0B6|nr:39S ribosomal protein L13, mitochondrial-like [Pollicipes pollicipes]